MVHEYSSSNILARIECHPGMHNCTMEEEHSNYESPGLYYSKLILLFLILILGTIGNALAFAVMFRRTLRRTPVSIYLRFIAFFDTLVLWTGCLASIILKLTQPNDYLYSPATCLLFKAVPEFARCVSAWLLMVLAIQRVVTIYGTTMQGGRKPLQRSLFTCSLVVFCWLLGYGYNFFIWRTHHGGYACTYYSWVDKQYKMTIGIWVINVAYAFVPAPVLIICSMLLVRKTLGQEHLIKKRWNKPSRTSKHSFLPGKVKRMNIVIITIAVSYVLMTFPYAIAFSYFTSFAAEPPPALLYTEIPLYGNHAINFLLYVATGTKFRKELHKMLGCKQIAKTLHTKKIRDTSTVNSVGGLSSNENF